MLNAESPFMPLISECIHRQINDAAGLYLLQEVIIASVNQLIQSFIACSVGMRDPIGSDVDVGITVTDENDLFRLVDLQDLSLIRRGFLRGRIRLGIGLAVVRVAIEIML